MPERQYELGDAELEVLKVLWEEGPNPVREVLTHMHGRGRQVAYTTVQTLLTRLEHKGFVASDKSGTAFVYKATVTRDRVSNSRVNTLLEQMYDGAAGPLVLQLIRNERLTTDEISQLQQMIDALDQSGRETTKKDGKGGTG